MVMKQVDHILTKPPLHCFFFFKVNPLGGLWSSKAAPEGQRQYPRTPQTPLGSCLKPSADSHCKRSSDTYGFSSLAHA